MGTARNMFPSKDKRDLRQPILVEDLIQYDDLNSTGGGSGVTAVTATGPITSSGGSAPVISTSMATNRLIGRTSAGAGVMQEIEVGSGLSLSAGILSSTGPASPQNLQDVITVDKSITGDILTIGDNAGNDLVNPHSYAIGENSLSSVSGGDNLGIGFQAGANLGIGILSNANNISLGTSAGSTTTDGLNHNIAIGSNALKDTQSPNNVAIGQNAGRGDTGGVGNFGKSVFIGADAGWDDFSSTENTGDVVIAIGNQSLAGNTGSGAVGIGSNSGYTNTGNNAVFVGLSSGSTNTGSYAVGVGSGAASSNIGNDIVAIGKDAATSNQGDETIAIGVNTANSNTGIQIVAIGTDAGVNNGESNQFIISNSCLPSFATQAAAISYYTASTTLSTGCTYLYYIQNSELIGAYRT